MLVIPFLLCILLYGHFRGLKVRSYATIVA